YELHAMGDLLPREFFEENPGFFRMNRQGERAADWNLCLSAPGAVEYVCRRAVETARVLKPTTGRYFYWGDDNRPWCHCPKCHSLSDSDQALLLANHLLEALREVDSGAQVAYLAYANTLAPPEKVAPKAGVFLEFAPIHRRYDVPLAAADAKENRGNLELLDANLALFGADTAQALEYWLDASRFSQWKRPSVKIPWSREIMAADLDTYGGRGVRHITTFAVYVDAEYMAMHGEPPVEEYGDLLYRWPAKRG
ncbi:MAG TPA: DUF4838 domain-containing protein, partial [Candidatus Hydrogenedentes bacterium]|nr:DUF4838 domain-containing protein [Candidatus Hydrogenedentota bacterium]